MISLNETDILILDTMVDRVGTTPITQQVLAIWIGKDIQVVHDSITKLHGEAWVHRGRSKIQVVGSSMPRIEEILAERSRE